MYLCRDTSGINKNIDKNDTVAIYIEIINYIFRNEKVKSFRSIIDIIHNNELLAKYNDPESLDLLNRYFKINNIHLDFIKKS